MSNIRPQPPKNTPPSSPGLPGGLRPPSQRSLNSWSGPAWTNPSNPVQIKPPPTYPMSKLPPKLPPPPKGPGLGLFAKLKPSLPGLLFFGGLLFLDWWLNQPPPPGSTLPPPPPSFETNLPVGQEYKVWYEAESFSGGTFYTGFFITSGPFSSISEEEVIPGKVWQYFVTITIKTPQQVFGTTRFDLNAGNSALWATEIPLTSITNAVGAINIKRNSIRIVKIDNLTTNQPVPPIVIINSNPAPPYALAPTPQNGPPLTSPLPENPTPTNPVPLVNPPGTTPSFTPFPGQKGNKNDQKNDPPDEKETPPWFIPFPYPYSPFKEPFNFNPDPSSTTTGPYVVNDPVLDLGLNSPPIPITQPTPTTPTTNPTSPSNPSNKIPTTTPTTSPPDPNKDKNPVPFFPPFPIVNPKDPKIEQPPNNPPPVNQTPPGNNCCVPTPVDQKLDSANNKLDALTPTLQAVDFSVLKAINDKLGPQINGGLSGYLQDRFTKLWNSRVIDRALNLMAVGASLHNAIMLSRDLGTTLIETTGNVLAAVGIKNADGEAFDFSTIIGETVENFVKSAVGSENYTKLKQTWVKANRILTAGANLIDSVRSMQNTIIEAQEVVGGWVAKIGNGLSQDGVVNDNTIDWMPEKPNFKNPFLRAQETIENLTEATESVNQLAAAVIETQELTKQINDNYKAFTDEINIKSDEKKTKEKDKKEESESSEINKSDLKEGAPNDAD